MKAKYSPNSNSPTITEAYFEKCLKDVLTHDDSWTLTTQDKGTTLYSKTPSATNEDVSQRQEFKFVSHLKYNFLDLFETLRDVRIRKVAAKDNLAEIKWIENHEEYVVVAHLISPRATIFFALFFAPISPACKLFRLTQFFSAYSNRHDVVYVLTTSPNTWVVSQREMLTARAWNYFTDDEGLEYVVMVEKFTERDDVPPSDTHVRAKVLYQVCVFKQCATNPDTECDWTFIMVMDVGGWVPSWIMDWLIKLAPDSVAREMEGGYAELSKTRAEKMAKELMNN